MTPLSGWENFYVIVGSSAGALIGLQFVVITLIAELPMVKDVERASSAFATPTIVHFGNVLLLSAVISVPWKEAADAAIAWALQGMIGATYVLVVARRMRTQTAYKPQFEDWLFHLLLPLTGYVILLISGWLARSRAREAMLAIAGSALLLLFTGIHNAWDAVTYNVYSMRREPLTSEKPGA